MNRYTDVYSLSIVDIEKEFVNVNWGKMFKILIRAGEAIMEKLLLYKLYKNDIEIIKLGDIQKEKIIFKGVRQRCTLTPLIINAYIQEAIDAIRQNT